MTRHKQVWIKVNAQVDAGVAELIEALNTFPGLRTLESCEGSRDQAWVCFDCADQDWQSLSEIVFETLGPPLLREFGDLVALAVEITEIGFRAEMTVAKKILSKVSDAILRLTPAEKAA